MQSALECRLAEVKDPRRLPGRESFDITEHDGGAQLGWELAQRSAQRFTQLVALGARGRAGASIFDLVDGVQFARHHSSARGTSSQSPMGLVEADAGKRGEEARAALETVKATPGAKKGLLGHFTGLGVVEPIAP